MIYSFSHLHTCDNWLLLLHSSSQAFFLLVVFLLFFVLFCSCFVSWFVSCCFSFFPFAFFFALVLPSSSLLPFTKVQTSCWKTFSDLCWVSYWSFTASDNDKTSSKQLSQLWQKKKWNKIWRFPNWKQWLQEFSGNLKDRKESLSRYNTDIILYPEMLWYCICRMDVCTNRKPAPLQVVLIIIFPGEAAPRATGKSKELIINIRSQAGKQPVISKTGCQQPLLEGRL